jgi:hypothetical protein
VQLTFAALAARIDKQFPHVFAFRVIAAANEGRDRSEPERKAPFLTSSA